MTSQHPLTDDIIHAAGGSTVDYENWYYDEDDIRAAADWQLEQVIEWLRSAPSREYVHLWDLGGDAEMDKDELITDLKKAMRPQQQQQQESN